MRSYLLLPLLTGILAGCTVGPNYAGPPKAVSGTGTGFVRADAQTVTSAPPVAQWWKTLDDSALDDLITHALANNTDVAVAEARLRQSRAALGEERANFAPKVSGSALYAHAHVPGVAFGATDSSSDGSGSGSSGSSGSDLNLYNLGFNASWEVDLFGGQRRAVEAARATAEGAEASLADVQVSLSAEVANTYLNLRDRQQRIALGQQAIALQEEVLGLTRQRLERGTATAMEVTQIEGQLAGTRAQLSPLMADRDAYLNSLAVLTGQEPGAVDAGLVQARDIPLPPASVPVGDPAQLIARRPDIRSAERTLAADTAKIGQSEAARFPSLSFMGLIGIGGTKISDLGKLDDFTALAAPQLSWNFLDFGRNKAKVHQAEAVRDEAEARYRGTVLTALRDAEDSLARFREGRVQLAELARVREKAAMAEQLTAQRFAAGTATRIALLNARGDLNTADQNLVTARASLTSGYVLIQKSLGLAWQ
ncbi:NodT family efflux transporter outer membrane factor (OMF) lipoprotein [Novosphingobium sp. PhB165]|uniref:efflux transporter outer membrane subunit n=1 Tax=Novosphingobium sp. PhB165 TaxID=2485105 RepID=UPI001049E5ED|nr:efflux transporter outer membrane subunit [Novosphingobium sp. PhB165]TCM15725.1 NodT family efflux transporter outer membrane factor (OMF) lipoprotein [Novosphingobium sp. PhB165]